jgi:DNA modification methylase
LRDYGVAGQLGLEKTPEEYVSKLVEILLDVRRVLRKDGTLWLNLGDSYAGSWGNYHPNSPPGKHGQRKKATERFDRPGYQGQEFLPPTANFKSDVIKAKDLVGIPWMVAFALRADGWYLRSDIIWAKPNPMPESVTDRPTRSHEYLFLLTKSPRYCYDADAIAEPLTRPDEGQRKTPAKFGGADKWPQAQKQSRLHSGNEYLGTANGTRNKRSVWTVSTKPFADAHFATFPPDLIEPCILAGTSACGACAACGSPWERDIERTPNYGRREAAYAPNSEPSKVDSSEWKPATIIDNGWKPTCECNVGEVLPCVVLDPFAGSGTTGKVAIELGRRAILIEPKAEYVEMIERRCKTTIGLPLAI